MKKIFPIAILSLIILSSCEKVIDIDLSKVEKKYVIEAILTDAPGAKVNIIQTKDFDEDNTFPGISGATVTITETGGSTTTLPETTIAGVYEAPALAGTSGKTYLLSVSIGGKNFTATCTMPQKVNLDTIYVTDELLFGGTRKIVNAVNNDPPGLGNNYRFIQYVNNKREDQILIRNDEYSDGRKVISKLFYFGDDDEKIKAGDTVKVDFQCISAEMYKYWYSLDRSSTGSGGGGQATPSNPVTNMQGGALGYFSAHTLQTKTLIVP